MPGTRAKAAAAAAAKVFMVNEYLEDLNIVVDTERRCSCGVQIVRSCEDVVWEMAGVVLGKSGGQVAQVKWSRESERPVNESGGRIRRVVNNRRQQQRMGWPA